MQLLNLRKMIPLTGECLRTFAAWLILCSILALSPAVAAQPATAGEIHGLKEVATPGAYSAGRSGVIWSTTIVHDGADFIKVKFADFSIAIGDIVVVRNPDNTESYPYGADSPRDFWSTSVFGDRVVIELISSGTQGGDGFSVPRYAAGQVRGALLGSCELCGVDVECPNVPAAAYPLRTPVCAIICVDPDHDGVEEDVHVCSGYQITFNPNQDMPVGYVLTNQHCLPAAGPGGGAIEIWFNKERMMCGAGPLKPIAKYTPLSLVECCSDCKSLINPPPGCGHCMRPLGAPADLLLDYALLRIMPAGATDPHPKVWGKLKLRSVAPVAGEAVWRFHHSQGGPPYAGEAAQKQFSQGVVLNMAPPNPNAVYWNYDAFGAGGSSGSPVIGVFDECVIAHHGYVASPPGAPGLFVPGCICGKGSEMAMVVADMIAQGCLPPEVELCTVQPVPPGPDDPPTAIFPRGAGPLANCCPWDVNQSGVTTGADLLILIAAWGAHAPPGFDTSDFDHDCNVNLFDLLNLIANWGPC